MVPNAGAYILVISFLGIQKTGTFFVFFRHGLPCPIEGLPKRACARAPNEGGFGGMGPFFQKQLYHNSSSPAYMYSNGHRLYGGAFSILWR